MTAGRLSSCIDDQTAAQSTEEAIRMMMLSAMMPTAISTNGLARRHLLDHTLVESESPMTQVRGRRDHTQDATWLRCGCGAQRGIV